MKNYLSESLLALVLLCTVSCATEEIETGETILTGDATISERISEEPTKADNDLDTNRQQIL